MQPIPANLEDITRIWRRWGGRIVSIGRVYHPGDVRGLVIPPGPHEEPADRGLVTWATDEIVTLDAFEERRGYGSALLGAAEDHLRQQGVGRVRLMTSNDNTHALRFYLKRGYRLVRIHPDAFNEVFRVKPNAPRVGNDAIPLRDLWELHKPL
jgi:GNAT superfamily N-acetyltransferase